jgi:ribosomal protein S18 acetylase RimI-like enzyme
MEIIDIDEKNIDREHICCAIGNDKENASRAQTKKVWMKQNFREGLVFKRLDERGKVFIEYMPIERAWKPVIGENYLLINCLWVSGKFKGQGWASRLLETCIQDAKLRNRAGIAVVTSSKKKPFLTEKEFFENKGFETVDTAAPYFELMVLKLKNAKPPVFSASAKTGSIPVQDGIAFIYSNQCPFMEEYVTLMAQTAQETGFPVSVRRLESYLEAKETGSPFGTLGIYYNGGFKTHELMSLEKFATMIKTW